MSLVSFIEQPETMNPGAGRYEYPERFNLLDLIGISHYLSPVNPRPDKSSPPEEDRYGNPIFHWELIAECYDAELPAADRATLQVNFVNWGKTSLWLAAKEPSARDSGNIIPLATSSPRRSISRAAPLAGYRLL